MNNSDVLKEEIEKIMVNKFIYSIKEFDNDPNGTNPVLLSTKWKNINIGYVAEMKIKGNIKKCPKCKSENGFYVLVKIILHSSDHFSFDGEYLDKTKTWDTIRTTQEKIAYCNQCNHKISVVRN